ATTEVDERGLHAGQHVLHAAEVDVAHHRGLRLAGHEVLDQDVVLEHRDLGPAVAGTHHHRTVHGLTPGEELRLGDDRAATVRVAPLTAALALRLEPGRTLERGDLVAGTGALVAGRARPPATATTGAVALAGLLTLVGIVVLG